MIRMRDIQNCIEKSIKINRAMLDVLRQANSKITECEFKFIDLLAEQSVNLEIKRIAKTVQKDQDSQYSKDVRSDLIHIFEFEIINIKGYKTKIQETLGDRRKLKLLVGYANRVQQDRGFTNSIYWYNRYQTNEMSYVLRTNITSELVKNIRISRYQ